MRTNSMFSQTLRYVLWKQQKRRVSARRLSNIIICILRQLWASNYDMWPSLVASGWAWCSGLFKRCISVRATDSSTGVTSSAKASGADQWQPRLLIFPQCNYPNLIICFMKQMLGRLSEDWQRRWGHRS